jgi:hypothetical protein
MPNNVLTTYSGIDTNFSLVHPLIAAIQADGVSSKGIAQITVRMSQTQSVMQVGMDGAVVPSVIPGDQGEIELQVWQTSTLHQELLAWYNAVKAARDAGDVSTWFSATVVIQNIVDGSTHTATGVGPMKVPDKQYAEQAGRVSWVLAAANISSE